jgi:hypothetical protein
MAGSPACIYLFFILGEIGRCGASVADVCQFLITAASGSDQKKPAGAEALAGCKLLQE